MDTPDRFANSELPGGYCTRELVGSGKFAWVYDGLAPNHDRVAIKILYRHEEHAKRRFAREIKVMRELPRSPHCVAYRDHGRTADGHPWLAMEFIDGVTLTTIFATGRRLEGKKAETLMNQLCKGIAGMHKLGLAHRDLNPDNIMITRKNARVKLMDLGMVQDSQGLLKLFEQERMVEGDDFSQDIDAGLVVGSVEYMAPEQISDAFMDKGHQRTDTTADVYTLGLIFYQLLTGRKLFPFNPTTDEPEQRQKEMFDYMEWRLSVKDEDLQRPPEINAHLWGVLERALRRKSKLRFGSALEFGSAIQLYLVTGEAPDEGDTTATIKGFAGMALPELRMRDAPITGADTIDMALSKLVRIKAGLTTQELKPRPKRDEPSEEGDRPSSDRPANDMRESEIFRVGRAATPRRAAIVAIALGVIVAAAVAIILTLELG